MKMRRMLLSTMIIFTLMATGCGEKGEPAAFEVVVEKVEAPTEAEIAAPEIEEDVLEISQVLADPEAYLGRPLVIRGTFVQTGAEPPIEAEDSGLAMLVEDYDLYLQNTPMPPGNYIMLVGEVYRDDLMELYDEQGLEWPGDEYDPLEFAEIHVEGELVPIDQAGEETFSRLGFDTKPWPDSEPLDQIESLEEDVNYFFILNKIVKVAGKVYDVLSKASAPPRAIPAGRGGPRHQLPDDSYAIIISGGVNANGAYDRYTNDVIFAWTVFRELGMANADIEVLLKNGAAVNVGGVNIVDGAANLATLRNTFTAAANKVKKAGDGDVYIVTTNHGGGYHRERGKLPASYPLLVTTKVAGVKIPGPMSIWTRFDGAAGDPTSDEGREFDEPADNVDYNRNAAKVDRFGVDELLYLWGANAAAQIHDDELVTEVEKLRNAGATIYIVMEQCFSGGFSSDLLRLANAIWTMPGSEFASATSEEQVSYAGGFGQTNYDEYLYHFLSALRGADADALAINADADGDGSVSWLEAHEYADRQDTQKAKAGASLGDDPQYVEIQFAGIVGPSGPVQLASVEAVADEIVRITLTKPDSLFLQKMAFPAFGIMSPAAIEEYGTGISEAPVGTGPFQLAYWEPDQSMTLSRFDDYWGEPVELETISYVVLGDSSTRLGGLLAGDVDGADIDLGNVDEARQYGLQVLNRPYLNVGYLGINHDRAPFNDLLVRQAIALAIDKEGLLVYAYPETAQVASQFVPPGCLGHSDGMQDWPYDPDLARDLLAQAGYPNGFDTSLYVMDIPRPYVPVPDETADVIGYFLDEVGITVELVVKPWGEYLDAVFNGEADLFLLGLIGDLPHAADFLNREFGEDGYDLFGQPYPELVSLLSRGSRTLDALPIYDQANHLIHDLVPMVPLAHTTSTVAFQEGVSNVMPGYNGIEFFAPVSVSGSDQLLFAHAYDATSLDPAVVWDYTSFRVSSQILETLIAHPPGSSAIVPGLAEDWDVSSDLTEWTFYLRPGVIFHDGTPLNAEAVVFNIERWWDQSNPYHFTDFEDYPAFDWFFGGFK
jgi:peptide/nickel transport system substrate-binding protein